MKSQFFPNRVFWRLDLATRLSREFKPRVNGLANLGLLSYSATAGVTLQLLTCLARVQHSGGLQPRATYEIQPQVPASLHNFEQFFTLSHTLLLHDSHLNTGLLIAKIQANLAWNKANKMVDKIQLYTRQSDSRIQLACQLFSKLGSMHFFPNPLTNSQKSTNCFYHRLMD